MFPCDHWESLCYVSFWSLIVFVFCFLLIIDSLCVLFPCDHCQNTQTINDQKETEHKDSQWSKGNRTQRLSMIKRKQSFDHWESLCYVSLWSLRVFVFCFLLIIDSLCVLFHFVHWESLRSVSFWSLIVFVFCFLLIIESLKDSQWSQGNIT
jgi:hypothetical protein